MNHERKNAIVTGGASGLGRALCRRLARDGWNIAICDINETCAEETAAIVKKEGGDGFAWRLDVTEPAEWERLRDHLKREWSRIDLLCNNAGVAGAGAVGQFSLDDWRWIMNVNLWNGIYGCHYFIDWMKENPGGAHIINTASLAAVVSAPGMAGYNVTKAGMVSLSETLFAELAPHNIGVTVVCPAFFSTNLLQGGRFVTDELKRFAEAMFKTAKMTADDVADAAIRAMRRKQLYVVVPGEARFQWWFKRLAPSRFIRYVAKMARREVSRANTTEAAR